jgi:hypothetical protein
MRRKNLLFVTYQNRQSEDGLAYAIQLAKTLGKGLSILMVQEKKGLVDGFSDAMAAVAFAEAGEHDTAREMMKADGTVSGPQTGVIADLSDRCKTAGVRLDVKSSGLDATSAIKGTLTGDDGIEMILLGPNVTESENFTAKRLTKLIKSATMPIVTIARQTCAA